jgi:hypothetical protein
MCDCISAVESICRYMQYGESIDSTAMAHIQRCPKCVKYARDMVKGLPKTDSQKQFFENRLP